MLVNKSFAVGAIVLALIGLGYWGASTLVRRESPLCQICQRPIHPGQEYVIELIDGRREHACCPRCGLHFQIHNSQRVRAAWATDYLTGERIDPTEATYVEASDVMTCCSTRPLKRGPESAAQLVWDRCLPALIAFQTREEAERFQQQHGGRLLTYPQALESVRKQ